MRIGFAITGIGAACAFGVVATHTTLARHADRSTFLASEASGPGLFLMSGGLSGDPFGGGEGGELIDIAQIGSGLGPLAHPPGSPFGDTPADPIPLRSLQRGFAALGGFPIGGGGGGVGGAEGGAPSSGLPPPADPPEKPEPPNQTPPAFGGLVGGGGGAPAPPDVIDPGPPSPPGLPPPTPTVFTTPPSPPPPVPPPPPPPLRLTAFAPPPAAVSSAPEPATWTTMLLGFALLGAVLRRSRSAHTDRAPSSHGA